MRSAADIFGSDSDDSYDTDEMVAKAKESKPTGRLQKKSKIPDAGESVVLCVLVLLWCCFVLLWERSASSLFARALICCSL